ETGLRNTTGTVSGAVTLKAEDDTTIILVAGAGGFGGKAGIGAAVAFTQIDDTVRSTINNTTNLKHTANVDVDATAGGNIIVVTGSAGISTGDNGFGAAGTVSVNFITNT